MVMTNLYSDNLFSENNMCHSTFNPIWSLHMYYLNKYGNTAYKLWSHKWSVFLMGI